jgi:FKBP-type peptidyl-prolyl cis-trans isomerase
MENGKVFDQNILGDLYKLTIGSDDVPSGWNFSVQGMQLNGEREVTVPPPYAKDLHPDIPRSEAITMNVSQPFSLETAGI